MMRLYPRLNPLLSTLLVGPVTALLVSSVWATTIHVSPFGSNTPPYSSYSSAANLPSDALAASSGYGDTVLIHAGQYDIDTAYHVPQGVAMIGIDRDSVSLNWCCYYLYVPKLMFRLFGDNEVSGITFDNVFQSSGQNVSALFTTVHPPGTIRIHDCNFIQVHVIGTATDTVDVFNCYFVTGEGDGVQSGASGGALLVHDNYFWAGTGGINPDCVSLSLGGQPVIWNNIFDLSGTNHTGTGVFANNSYNGVIVRNNLFKGGNQAVAVYYRNAVIENNTVVDGNSSLVSPISVAIEYGDTVTIRNNAIFNARSPFFYECAGSCGAKPVAYFLHNTLCPTDDGFPRTVGGGVSLNITDSGNAIVYPMFAEDSVYRLQEGSPLIDAGDPSILDVDGSRSDIGWLGGPWGETYAYEEMAPEPPESLWVDGTASVVSATWSSRPEADLAGYRLYHGSSPGFWHPGLTPISEYSDGETTGVDTILEASSLYYVVTAFDTAGLESGPSPEREFVMTGIFDDQAETFIPSTPQILAVYPNPFNASTTIEVRIPDIGALPAPITVIVYNILGQQVGTVFDGSLPSGVHQIAWNGTSDHDSPLASGLYFVRLSVWNSSFDRPIKVILLK